MFSDDPNDPADPAEPADDADISEALHDDERLLPDLAGVRREVLGRRRALRNRNRLAAAGLVAACVLVVGSVIALAGVRANDDRSGAAGSADGQVSIQTWTTNSYPPTPASPTAAAPTAAPSVAGSSSAGTDRPAPSTDRPSSAQSSAGAAATPRPTLAQHDDMYGPISHCDGVMSAWPVSGAGLVDPRALRAAVNECSTMFGPARASRVRYVVASLRAVTEQAPEITINGADLSQRVLVVRLDGRFDGLAVTGYVPSTVQLYLLLEGHQWIGAYAPAPAQDLATLGSAVRTLP